MTTKDTVAKFQSLGKELNAIIVERENEIEGSLAALIAGVHVLFLGPPGTAKSMLANSICKAIDGGQYFQWLMTRFSNPEELFGPPSLKGLKNDEYRRITKNKLPEAHISFLDECFKANSAILNALLTLINERKFHNDGNPVTVPLLTCFAASNELPQGEDLGALYDRFILRYWVSEVRDEENFRKLMNGEIGNGEPATRITIDEIKALQATLDTDVAVPMDILTSLRTVQQHLISEKGIKASDRRWKTAVRVLRALALLRGRKEVTMDDLESLADMMWRTPEERRSILEIVSPLANPLNLKAIEYLDAATEAYNRWKKEKKDDKAVQANGELKEIMKSMEADMRDRPKNKLQKMEDTKARIAKMQEEIIRSIMG